MVKLIILWLICLTAPTAFAEESTVEIIPVYNRPASEIQPLLQQLLEPGEQVIANGDNLIVKTPPERLSALKNLIRQIDSPVSNLQITVVQSRELTAEQLNTGLGGDIYVNGNGSLQGGFGAYANQSQGNGALRNAQTLRTQEGMAAHIQAGNAIPVTTYQSYGGDRGGYWSSAQSTQYIQATTGFAVTPRLSGNQVTLDVAPWSNRLNNGGQFETQDAETTVRANLGEWIEIGGIDESSQNMNRNFSAYQTETTQNRLKILLRVDKVNR